MSGCPGKSRRFRTMRQRGPIDSRTKEYNAFSTFVPLLLMRDMISLRFVVLKISANSTTSRGQLGFNSFLVYTCWGKICRSCKGKRNLVDSRRKNTLVHEFPLLAGSCF